MTKHGFEKILDEMARDEVERERERRALRQPASLWADLTEIAGRLIGRRAMPPVEAEDEEDQERPAAPSLEPAVIVAELGLTDGMDRSAIEAARRAFAKTNHPDRCVPALAGSATIRMQIANDACEKALRRLPRQPCTKAG